MRLACIAAAVLAPLAAPAVAGRVQQDGQFWVNINAQGSLKGRLLYYAELQPRFPDGGDRIGQVLARGAIGWKLSDAVSVYQGYAHVAEPDDALPRDRNEERSFQQLTWSLGSVAGGKLSSRTRFEQRWVSPGRDMGLRVRDMIRYTHPIGRDPKGVAALVSVEPFVNLDTTDWGARAGLDQVRTNAALEIPLTGRTTIEVGYLNQALNRPAGAWAVNHVFQLLLALRP